MLLYYIRSAPLKSITKEFASLLQAKTSKCTSMDNVFSGHKALNKSIADLSLRLDKAIAAFDEREQRLALLESAVAPFKYIRNCSSGVWHFAREHVAGHVCFSACGGQYTGVQFDVSLSLPCNISPQMLCGTCLPKSRLEAMVV